MKRISRRLFTRDAVVIAAAAAVAPRLLGQTDPTPPRTAGAELLPAQSPPAPAPGSQAEVEARVQWIISKYGAHLNEEQRADVRRLVAAAQPAIEAMRRYDLENGSAPAGPFRIYRRTVHS